MSEYKKETTDRAPFPGGPPRYPAPHPAGGFQQSAAPPPGYGDPPVASPYYPPTQATPIAGVASPYTGGEQPLPCGCGIGWVLFILGFLFGLIPWYIGAGMLLCLRDKREKPGFVACAIASVIGTILVIIIVAVSRNNQQ